MPGFDKAAYTAAYNKANYHSYTIRFNIKSESDIIRRISEEGSAKEYIMRLIRQDIKARERRNPYIISRKPGKRPVKKAASYQHDHLKEFPYEVLEARAGGGYRSIGYAENMDNAVVIILNYMERGTPAGEMVIVQRDIVKKSGYGGWECRPGTVIAVRYGDAKK